MSGLGASAPLARGRRCTPGPRGAAVGAPLPPGAAPRSRPGRSNLLPAAGKGKSPISPGEHGAAAPPLPGPISAVNALFPCAIPGVGLGGEV